MPESIIILAFSTLTAILGLGYKKLDIVDRRVGNLEVKVAETYMMKEDLNHHFEYLFARLDKIDSTLCHKLDATYAVEQERITLLKQIKDYHD